MNPSNQPKSVNPLRTLESPPASRCIRSILPIVTMDPNGTFLFMLFMWTSNAKYSLYLEFDFRRRISSCLHQYLYSQYRTIYTGYIILLLYYWSFRHPTSNYMLIEHDFTRYSKRSSFHKKSRRKFKVSVLREKTHWSKAKTSHVLLPINFPVFLMKMWSSLRKWDIHGFSGICFSRNLEFEMPDSVHTLFSGMPRQIRHYSSTIRVEEGNYPVNVLVLHIFSSCFCFHVPMASAH